MEIFVVKRKGHQEQFDEKKVYASVYSSALNCHFTEKDAEKIADMLTKKILIWMKGNPTITSHVLKLRITKELKAIDRDVSMMYELHMNLC